MEKNRSVRNSDRLKARTKPTEAEVKSLTEKARRKT